ncbi:MAG: DUF6542 domain-containing protein [Nocardioidaceae bacterium]
MTSSANPTPEPMAGNDPDIEFDLLVSEPDFPDDTDGADLADSPIEPSPHVDREVWRDPVQLDDLDDATEYAASPGMPGRGIVLSSAAATVVVTGLDFALTGGLTYFFDLCFVVICLLAAMGVRRIDIFTAGVLPPLVFGVLIAAVTLLAPSTFVHAAGLGQTFLTGLAQHAGALVAGYAVALSTVALRMTTGRNSPG